MIMDNQNKPCIYHFITVLFVFAVAAFTGCASSSPASRELVQNNMGTERTTPRDLKVGVSPFTYSPDIVGGETAEPQNSRVHTVNVDRAPEAVRKVESYSGAVVLRDVLQSKNAFESVTVRPANSKVHDLIITGHILSSTGNYYEVEFTVTDITGREWFSETYEAVIPMEAYANRSGGDPYEPLYEEFAVELLGEVREKGMDDLWALKETSDVIYASSLSPQFNRHLSRDGREYSLVSLPADNDPFFQFAQKSEAEELRILEEDFGQYYTSTHMTVYPQYFDWRREYGSSLDHYNRLTEGALEKRRGATALGVMRDLAIGAALGAGMAAASGGDPAEGAAWGAGVAGASAALRSFRLDENGELTFDVTEVYARDPAFREAFESAKADMEQANSYHAYMQSQSQALGNFAQPINVRLFDETMSLQGDVDEQYGVLRERVAAIYAEETSNQPSTL